MWIDRDKNVDRILPFHQIFVAIEFGSLHFKKKEKEAKKKNKKERREKKREKRIPKKHKLKIGPFISCIIYTFLSAVLCSLKKKPLANRT